jgi:glycosyltransferase involved in cell wall biosynthesis
VTASEHEGFCIPLVEAMTFEKPIIARACAAIPETVGDAGFLIPPDQGPAFFAEAVTELLGNQPLRQELVAGGRRRLAELESCPADVGVVEALLEVV